MSQLAYSPSLLEQSSVSIEGSGPVLALAPLDPRDSRDDHQGRDGSEPRSDRAHQLAEDTQKRFLEAAVADDERRHQLLDEVVTTHLWLADTLARRYYRRGEDDQDLLQIARAGLVEATQRFDPDRGSFYSFAVPTVLGVLKRHFRDRSWDMRPPRRTQELANEIRRGWPYLVQDLGAIPSEADLASHLGASVAEVREARYASQGYSGTALDPTIEPDRETARSRVEGEIEARLLLARVWAELDPKDRHLIRLRFYDELSQVEIAKILGTSQMQVSRYLARLLHKLRLLIGDEGHESLAS